MTFDASHANSASRPFCVGVISLFRHFAMIRRQASVRVAFGAERTDDFVDFALGVT
jgi:hypothetical protein